MEQAMIQAIPQLGGMGFAVFFMYKIWQDCLKSNKEMVQDFNAQLREITRTMTDQFMVMNSKVDKLQIDVGILSSAANKIIK